MTGIITTDSLKCAGFTPDGDNWVKMYEGGDFEKVMGDEIGVEIELFPFEDENEPFNVDVYDLQDKDCCPYSSDWFDSIKG